MKKILMLPTLLILFSCSSQKKAAAFSDAIVKKSDCPADGECKVTIEKDKALAIKTDEFGSLYYNVVDAPGKNVILYEYSKHVDTTLADAGHREQIVFEVDAANPDMELSGFTLANGNVLFGRFCFCRGATGYYRVREGNLSVKKAADNILVRMNFKITEVPQTINKFDFIIK